MIIISQKKMPIPNAIRDTSTNNKINTKIEPGTITGILTQLLTLAITWFLLYSQQGNEFLQWIRPQYYYVDDNNTVPTIEFKNMIMIMVTMRVVSQCVFFVFIATYQVPIGIAIGIGIFNLVCDCLTIIFADHGAGKFDQIPHDMLDVIAITTFIVGTIFERIPEIQRIRWKSNPANKGKSHQQGLYGWIVHANYFGYVLWRFGMALFGRSPWLQLITVNNLYTFIFGEIPAQHQRNIEKYGPSFDRYWKKTWKLIPGIY
jgi:protein-S-isoprenylcysteine O-methyltransferase Ste14